MRLGLAIWALLAALSIVGPVGAEELAIVVHADRKTDLDLDQVRQIYLRQRRFWGDGDPIVPINRDAGSASREAFDHRVLGLDARRLAVYWNRAYFDGVLPPATLASDEAVRRFVAGEPRAIGYLPRAAVDDSVRVVLLLPGAESLRPAAAADD